MQATLPLSFSLSVVRGEISMGRRDSSSKRGLLLCLSSLWMGILLHYFKRLFSYSVIISLPLLSVITVEIALRIETLPIVPALFHSDYWAYCSQNNYASSIIIIIQAYWWVLFILDRILMEAQGKLCLRSYPVEDSAKFPTKCRKCGSILQISIFLFAQCI